MPNASPSLFFGIDGCPAGWLVAVLPDTTGDAAFRFRLTDERGLEALCRHASLALIDIPIGLPSRETEPRQADAGARRLLPGHGSRVFPVPVREAVYARSYQEANALNRAICDKGVTRQAWNICPQIRQVDQLLRRHPAYRRRLRESSPEVCFAVLAGRPLAPKRSAGGLAERLDVLRRFEPRADHGLDAARAEFPRRAVATDDILDAMVLCVSATLIGLSGRSCRVPAEAVYDEEGLAMQMLYPAVLPSRSP